MKLINGQLVGLCLQAPVINMLLIVSDFTISCMRKLYRWDPNGNGRIVP